MYINLYLLSIVPHDAASEFVVKGIGKREYDLIPVRAE